MHDQGETSTLISKYLLIIDHVLNTLIGTLGGIPRSGRNDSETWEMYMLIGGTGVREDYKTLQQKR